MAEMDLPSILDFCVSNTLSLSWWSLGKHIHDDYVARLIVHHKVEHMSSNLIGIEGHGVITRVELIGTVLCSGRVSLNYLVESC